MLYIVTGVMMFVLTLAFPPLAFITIPLAIIYFDRKAKQAKELRRQRDVFVQYQSDQERYKAFRGR